MVVRPVNKFLAVVVLVTGYLGVTRILGMFIPEDMPLDSWGDWGFFALPLLLVFLPIWTCVALAGEKLWDMEVER